MCLAPCCQGKWNVCNNEKKQIGCCFPVNLYFYYLVGQNLEVIGHRVNNPTLQDKSVLLFVELATHKSIIRNPLQSRRYIYILFIFVVIFQVARTVVFFANGGWNIFWHENIFARLLGLFN